MLTRSRSSRRLVAALIFLLALLAGACSDSDVLTTETSPDAGSDGGSEDGGSEEGGSLADAFARAAERTKAAETVHTELIISFDDVPGAEGMSITTEGDSTIDGTTGRFRLSQPGLDVEFLVVDEAYYYKFPGLPDGINWVRMTFDEVSEMSGMDVNAMANQSPTETLSRLEASGDIEELGSEDIDGVSTTHYRAVLDIEKMNAQTGVASEELLEQMRGLMGDSYEMDIWIDDDGYVRRITYAIDLAESPDPPVGMPSEGRIVYEMTMSDFGEPLDVVAPPDDEVMDYSDFN